MQIDKILPALFVAILTATAGPVPAQDVDLDILENRGTLRPVVRAASLTLALEDDAAPQDYVAAARADYERLLSALFSEGFYGGRISIRIDGREAASIAPLDAPRQVSEVVIEIDPGPRFVFGRTEIGPLAPGTTLPEEFATGATARSTTIGNAAVTAVDAWRDVGHARADIASEEVIARHPETRLDVRLILDPGPRLVFGEPVISGEVRVREERIRRIAGLPVGRTFSPAEIEAAAARLRRTGAFQSVAIVERSPTGPGNVQPIEIQVLEQKPRRIGFGAEYSNIDGLTLSAFWLHRYLLGGAERFRIEGEVAGIGGSTGGIDYGVNLSFNRPATIRRDTDLFANASIQRIDDPGYRLDTASAEVGLIRYISDDLTVDAGIGFVVGEVSDDIGTRTYAYLTLPLGGEIDRRDDELDASEGYYLRLDLVPFVDPTNGDAGGRLYADGRYYLSFGEEDRLTFAIRGQAGAVFGVEAEEAPPDFLFFSGGGGTVRGQPYQSLGVDTGGGEIGGRGFVGTQTELRFDVTERIGIVGFVDAGYIAEDPFDFSGGEWHAGAGIGARYQTGIGPIRIDLAIPVTGDNAGEQLQLYIGIGQAF